MPENCVGKLMIACEYPSFIVARLIADKKSVNFEHLNLGLDCVVFLCVGLLGALDPYKHKVNLGQIERMRDAGAVLSEYKMEEDNDQGKCVGSSAAPQ